MEDFERRAALCGADLLNDLGRPSEALDALRPALEAHPDDAQVLTLAALCHLDEDGDAVEALTLARRAARVAPGLDLAHRLSALAYLRLNQPARAREEAQTAVDLAPQSWAGHFVLGTAQLGDPRTRRAALDAARRAVALAPDRWETHQLLGRAYLDGGREPSATEADAAIDALEHALGLNPGSADLRHDLARAHLQRGRAGQAIGEFSRAALWSPKPVENVRAIAATLLLLARDAALLLTLTAALLWMLVPATATGLGGGLWATGGTGPLDGGVVRGGGGAPEWAGLVALLTVVAAGLGAWRIGAALRGGARGLVGSLIRGEPLVAGAGALLAAAVLTQLAAVALPRPYGRFAVLAEVVLVASAWVALGLRRLRARRRS